MMRATAEDETKKAEREYIIEYIIEQRHGVLREIAALRDMIRAKEQQEKALAKQAGLTKSR